MFNFLSYMSPSIPEAFYLELVRMLEGCLDVPVSMNFERCRSGPSRAELECGGDPFSTGRADLAFLCAPTYLWARQRGAARLLGYAPVFRDERYKGRPVYFSDVLVRRDSLFQEFEQLRGSTWAFNDRESLSGYFSMLGFLHGRGETLDFFGKVVCSGGHHRSLELLKTGAVDCAALDSNMLLFAAKSDPRLCEVLRTVKQIGPQPTPPVAVASAVSPRHASRLRRAFESLRHDRKNMEILKTSYLLHDFVPVTEGDYGDHAMGPGER